MRTQRRHAFTILELLFVTIVLGIFASMGVAKYGEFASTARKNRCLIHQQEIAAAIKVTEVTRGDLEPDTVLRLGTDSSIDNTRAAGLSTPYSVWLGTVPISWGVTNTGNNRVLRLVSEAKIFRCPEDEENLGVDYTGISNTAGQSGARPGSVRGLWGGLPDPRIYTYVNRLFSARQTFDTANPTTTEDPLEGFNWSTRTEEWQNGSFTFCRRYGRRNPAGSGANPLAGQTGDTYYVPNGEARLGHSEYAPTY